jgi:hypothetical protein
MKKLLCLVALFGLVAGCAGAEQSGFWSHDTMYKNFDHLKYSWSGYEDCGSQYTKDTKSQQWWGETVSECKK